MSIINILEVSDFLTYTRDMSWQDHMTDEEREELEAARAAKEGPIRHYNAVWRRIKVRCDARVRRLKERAERLDNPNKGAE